MKVVKFGGSSLASAANFEQIFQIITADSSRKIVVVSAPGKRFKEDVKVTDLLIDLATKALLKEETAELFEQIVARYQEIASNTGTELAVIKSIRSNLQALLASDKSNPDRFMDRIKASGEDNNAKLVAAFFNARGIPARYHNPKEAGLFVTAEHANAQVLQESYENLYNLREAKELVIFPGFFGCTKSGEISTFSRSGSDITGAILANGVKASLYENFTDVDAVFTVNPAFVHSPQEIHELTYREMRELSYAGFSIFHEEALLPAFEAGIPVHIKNTNNPTCCGTKIVKAHEQVARPVVGIASDNGFSQIYISKYLMNREIGFGRRVLSILEKYQLAFEHMPSGIDDLTVILRDNQLNSELEQTLIKNLTEELQADYVNIERDITLLMIVGESMRHNIGTTYRASQALANAGVNIEMINQGSSEVSIMFGIKKEFEKTAIRALYEEFFKSH
ncbi:aspartate kinase [Listeria aquatica]|uniref:aspartate kinase n=1 Tax=Listeria aquatica TaxID=1494960 RepID=UPI003F6EA3FD